jgi:hypothetical protein
MAFEESRGSADLRAHAPTAHPRLGDALDANDAIFGQFRGVAMIEQRFPTQARLNPVARSVVTTGCNRAFNRHLHDEI